MTKDITVDIENMDERTRDEYFMSIAMEEARKAYDLGASDVYKRQPLFLVITIAVNSIMMQRLMQRSL